MALLRQSLACWLPAFAEEDGGGDGAGPSAAAAAELPSFEFRFDTAKLLLDLDDTTVTAVRVLEARALRR